MRNLEKRNVTSSIITIIALFVTSVMTIVMLVSIAKTMGKNANSSVVSVATGRTNALTGYFDQANNSLNSFGNNSIVRNLLKDPDNEEYQKIAQKYTEDFSATIDNIEGIYIANWDTKVLTHTNQKVVGMVTRPKNENMERYMALTNAMLHSPKHLYTTGIIESPASGAYVYSAYQAIYDEGVDPSDSTAKPLGYVGIGIYSDNILKQLPDPGIKDVKDWNYYVINTDTRTIMASTKPEIIGETLDNETIDKAITDAAEEMGMRPSLIEYKNEKDYVSGFVTFNAYKTCVILETNETELHRGVRHIVYYLIIFVVITAIVLVATIIITRRQEKFRIAMNQQRLKNEKVTNSLNNAVFSDILTGVSNRAKFAIESPDARCKSDETFMFGMVNINNLAGINTQYGNDTGDKVISDVANMTKNMFKSADIYRTGSSEFIIVQRCNTKAGEGEQFLNKLEELKHRLVDSGHSVPGGGMITYPCSFIAARKSGEINTSVITILKDSLIRTGNQIGYSTQFLNLDA